MDKLLTYAGRTDRGVFNFLIDHERGYLTKTACEYHPTIAAYINSARKIPGKTQVLLTALGAGEYWGDNSNSDWFGEDQLAHEGADYGFKTFEQYAKVFKHHVNKDPKKSYGDVILAVYNSKFHRVELIVAIDNEKAPDIVEKIESGENVWWSMGCKIPYDVCNICGNKAPNRKFYCDHLKYELGTIHPGTGRKVYAINIKPKFFDISYVIIPADKTAIAHRKVAFAVNPGHIYDANGRVVGSAEAAEKAAAEQKAAAIVKEIPGNDAPASQDLINNPVASDAVRGAIELQSREKVLPQHLINSVGASWPLPKALATLRACAIALKPQEFQRLFLVSQGLGHVADNLERMNVCFKPDSDTPFGPEHLAQVGADDDFDTGLAAMLEPYFKERSNTAPLIVKRMIVMVKEGSHNYQPPVPVYVNPEDKADHSVWKTLATGAAIYAALQYANGGAIKSILALAASNPALAFSLGLDAASVVTNAHTVSSSVMNAAKAEPERYKGRFSGVDPVVADYSDLYDRIERMRERPYTKLGSALNDQGLAMAKRLLIGVPMVHMGSAALQKHRDMNPSEEEGSVKRFIRKNPNLLSGIVVADALLAAHGKGSYRFTSPMAKMQESFLHKRASLHVAAGIVDEGLDPTVKSASVQDYVTSSLVWPLAMGTANLPGRIVGSLFDQAALDLGQKLIEKRKQSQQQSVAGKS